MKEKIQCYQWHYILNGKRFKIAWHSLSDWIDGGWRVQSWFFSFRLRGGYSSEANLWGYWWQICFMGLNVGHLYKLQNESSDNYFECRGSGVGCPVMVAYESIWRYI